MTNHQTQTTLDLRPLLAAVTAAVREAGALLRAEALRPGGPRGHGHHADIDTEIEYFLRAKLLALLPAFWRGEETGTQAAAASFENFCWLVDPHDGTAAFLKGHRGSSVSVALLRGGQPVLGVVFAPMSPDRGEDLIAWAEDCGPLTRNGQVVMSRLDPHKEVDERDIVFISQDAPRKAVTNADLCAPARFIALPSIAYRLARVAAGDGVCAVSLAGPAAHDYAAGHALLRGAGGVLFDECTRPVVYSNDGRSQTGQCFGGARMACNTLAKRSWYLVREEVPSPRSSIRGSTRIPSQRNEGLNLPALTHRRTPEREAMLARAAGTLFGQVTGDSLGSLVEFLAPASIALRYPLGVRALADGGTWGTLAGQPTDDSEMAITLARSLIACGGYNAEFTARGYANWLFSKPYDIGNTTRTALHAALRTLQQRAAVNAKNSLTPVADAARSAALRESAANGSLMRMSPIGVRYAGNIQLAAQFAREDSQLTHPNAVCQEACAAFCAAIADGVAGGDRESMLASARVVLRHDIAGLRIAEILDAAQTAALPEVHGEKQGWVLFALQVAFRQLLHADSFEEALVQVVGLGGDTDTNAAITGALLGALHGRDAIPAEWKLRVQACRAIENLAENPRPAAYWADDIAQVAEALLYPA